MEAEQHIWRKWAEALRHRGLGQIMATLLEASGPMNLVAAQMVYLGQPLLGSSVPDSSWQALAHLLEEPEQTQSFITYLREDMPR